MTEGDIDSGVARDLAAVLRTVGQELADLGELASELQGVLSPSGLGAGGDCLALDRMQGLDLLTQRLHGVSEFLHALAPTVPAHWLCEAIRAAKVVTLSDLARRLSCSSPDPSAASGEKAGEFELFEG